MVNFLKPENYLQVARLGVHEGTRLNEHGGARGNVHRMHVFTSMGGACLGGHLALKQSLRRSLR
jgi:hypothetical protein